MNLLDYNESRELLEFTNDTQVHEVFHFMDIVWMASCELNGHEFEQTAGDSEDREAWHAWGHSRHKKS